MQTDFPVVSKFKKSLFEAIETDRKNNSKSRLKIQKAMEEDKTNEWYYMQGEHPSPMFTGVLYSTTNSSPTTKFPNIHSPGTYISSSDSSYSFKNTSPMDSLLPLLT
jgi:hypothetical protein